MGHYNSELWPDVDRERFDRSRTLLKALSAALELDRHYLWIGREATSIREADQHVWTGECILKHVEIAWESLPNPVVIIPIDQYVLRW